MGREPEEGISFGSRPFRHLLALEDKQARGLGFDVDFNRMLVSFVAVLLLDGEPFVARPRRIRKARPSLGPSQKE